MTRLIRFGARVPSLHTEAEYKFYDMSASINHTMDSNHSEDKISAKSCIHAPVGCCFVYLARLIAFLHSLPSSLLTPRSPQHHHEEYSESPSGGYPVYVIGQTRASIDGDTPSQPQRCNSCSTRLANIAEPHQAPFIYSATGWSF